MKLTSKEIRYPVPPRVSLCAFLPILFSRGHAEVVRRVASPVNKRNYVIQFVLISLVFVAGLFVSAYDGLPHALGYVATAWADLNSSNECIENPNDQSRGLRRSHETQKTVGCQKHSKAADQVAQAMPVFLTTLAKEQNPCDRENNGDFCNSISVHVFPTGQGVEQVASLPEIFQFSFERIQLFGNAYSHSEDYRDSNPYKNSREVFGKGREQVHGWAPLCTSVPIVGVT